MTHTQSQEHWLHAPCDFDGLRVTVMGLGTFGGGIAAARFLADRGADVLVTDRKPEQELADSVSQLADRPGIRFHLGGHSDEDFTGADLVVLSPAVDAANPFVQTAVASGALLTTEMNLFWLHQSGRVIGVTGTTGKSTTTSLICEMLRAAGIPVWLGGNLGVSLLPHVAKIQATDWVVLELSSFQLEALDHLRVSPEIAVVTNVSPNHLDRHGSMENYRRAKQTILRWQSSECCAVLNADDPDVSGWQTNAQRVMFGRTSDAQESVRVEGDCLTIRVGSTSSTVEMSDAPGLPGSHNRFNAAAASAAAARCGVGPEPIVHAIRSFQGLPHRLQFLGEFAGRRIYNDSKATSPAALLAALGAFGASELVLIAGGADTGADFRDLATQIGLRARLASLYGPAGLRLVKSMTDSAPGSLHIYSERFDAAVRFALTAARPGESVVLSPGCPSYGEFPNYERRGERFASLVAEWAAGPPPR